VIVGEGTLGHAVEFAVLGISLELPVPALRVELSEPFAELREFSGVEVGDLTF
jgi:hypothetical protein